MAKTWIYHGILPTVPDAPATNLCDSLESAAGLEPVSPSKLKLSFLNHEKSGPGGYGSLTSTPPAVGTGGGITMYPSSAAIALR